MDYTSPWKLNFFARYGAFELPFTHISKSRVKTPRGEGRGETSKEDTAGGKRLRVIWPAALGDGVACAGRRASSSVKRDPRQRVGSSSHIPTDVRREQNAPRSRTHKRARRHSKMSHGRLLNTDNSCTCTRSRRGAPLSQSTFARSHKGAGRICRPPSVRLHLLPFFFSTRLMLELNEPFDLI